MRKSSLEMTCHNRPSVEVQMLPFIIKLLARERCTRLSVGLGDSHTKQGDGRKRKRKREEREKRPKTETQRKRARKKATIKIIIYAKTGLIWGLIRKRTELSC